VKEERDLLNAIAAQLGRIIERKQAEEAFQESEERYRVLVENANEAILVAQDEIFKFVNPKATDLMGYSEDELSSRPFAEFIHPDDRDKVTERYQRRLEGAELPQTYPFRIVDEAGDTRWVELNAVLITWEGRPATLNFLTDITERKRMEEELVKAQKLESVSILAGGIAHDFNNILTAILGNISLGKMYDDLEKKNSRLADAERACMQAKNLTQQLLTFSRGGAPIKKVSSMVELLKASATLALRGSNVRCEFSVPNDLWPAEVDQGQMNQVMSNIIINADQAMPDGGMITMQGENSIIEAEHGLPLQPGSYVEISIADQGIGIPEDGLPRIFDPYFTTKQTGSGLGLAVAYSIIRKHNGHISVESQTGVGTTFHIYLPASPEAVLAVAEKEEEKPITGAGRILVMDDEKYVRDLAAEMLSSIGYKVTTAIDGSEAIEMYREARDSGRPYDAVIMDLTVPGGMGGKEAIQRLVEIDPEVKAIVSSGYSNDPIMAAFREYGFRGVIAKPYKTRELSQVMREVMVSV
jgi:PAS domain S-box-containing protein